MCQILPSIQFICLITISKSSLAGKKLQLILDKQKCREQKNLVKGKVFLKREMNNKKEQKEIKWLEGDQTFYIY